MSKFFNMKQKKRKRPIISAVIILVFFVIIIGVFLRYNDKVVPTSTTDSSLIVNNKPGKQQEEQSMNTIHRAQEEKPNAVSRNSVPKDVEKSYKDIKPLLENAIVIYNNSNMVISRGEVIEGAVSPFIEKGITFASVNEVSDLIGAKLKSDENNKLLYLDYNGYGATFSLEYNAALMNNTPLVMQSKPIEKDGHVFLPVDVLAEALNRPCFRDYSQGVVVIGALKPLKEDDYRILKLYAGLEIDDTRHSKELDEIKSKVQIDDIYNISRENRLYVSDENAKLSKWVLLDDFSLSKVTQNVNFNFPKNTVFIAGEGADKNYLFKANETKQFSFIPDLLNKSDLMYTVMKYTEMKMASDMFGLSSNNDIIKMKVMYKSFISNHFVNTDLIKDKKTYLFTSGDSSSQILDIKKRLVSLKAYSFMPVNKKYDYYLFDVVLKIQKKQKFKISGQIDKTTYDYIMSLPVSKETKNKDAKREKWEQICKSAKSGDIMIFKNKEANEEYGYYTHAALVLDVSRTNSEIRVLQARNISKGVGADLPVDRVTFHKFSTDSYWKEYDIAFLLRVKGVTSKKSAIVAQKGYRHFKNYKFGYLGFLGKKETTCVEIIRDSYKLQNIDIINNIDYILNIKNALDGDTRSIALVPDDIIISDNIKIVDYWEK